jgi:hypothetical protein
MEGMVSTTATEAGGRQEVGLWVELCKVLLRSPGLRDETDIQFEMLSLTSTSVLSTTATHLLAALIEQDSADSERDHVCFTDADTNTFAGATALDITDLIIITPRVAGTDGTGEYVGFVLAGGPDTLGYPLNTGLSIGADGDAGTDVAAGDLRAWVLFRT